MHSTAAMMALVCVDRIACPTTARSPQRKERGGAEKDTELMLERLKRGAQSKESAKEGGRRVWPKRAEVDRRASARKRGGKSDLERGHIALDLADTARREFDLQHRRQPLDPCGGATAQVIRAIMLEGSPCLPRGQ